MPRRLTRDTDNAVLGGVAAGFADYFDLDPVLVRIGFILLCLLHGVGLIVYVVSWVIMPARAGGAVPGGTEAPAQERSDPGDGGETSPAGGETGDGAPAESPADRIASEVRQAGERVASRIQDRSDPGRGRIVAGGILIALGAIFLLQRLDFYYYWPHWLRFSEIWPVILVIIGIGMIVGAGRRSRD